ncbi:hypothetical protein AAZV13_07G195550 [Glycine max]|nr:hypothetical protein JHK86_019610 [Glycine max]
MISADHKSSIWWRDIVSIEFHSSCLPLWFSNSHKRQLGYGTSTSFWYEAWTRNLTIKESFPHLYYISDHILVSAADMLEFMVENQSSSGCWRRRLFNWEEDFLATLMDKLREVQLQPNCPDRWCWKQDNSNSFSVASAYNFLINHQQQGMGVDSPPTWIKHFWNSVVPS